MNAKHNTYAYFILFFIFLFLGLKMKPIEMKLVQQRKKGKKEGKW